jgi:hypothetical protein
MFIFTANTTRLRVLGAFSSLVLFSLFFVCFFPDRFPASFAKYWQRTSIVISIQFRVIDVRWWEVDLCDVGHNSNARRPRYGICFGTGFSRKRRRCF